MPKNPARLAASALIAITLAVRPDTRADDLLYRYEGDVLPADPSAGWVVADGCRAGASGCVELLQNGHFVLFWEKSGDLVNYDRLVVPLHKPRPPTLWVECGYRSEQPFDGLGIYCDGHLTVDYRGIHDLLQLFGDGAFTYSGDDAVLGLDMNQFHTYRFESLDGSHYWWSADGVVFARWFDNRDNGYPYLQFGGDGGCSLEDLPTTNEWDFIRYGTISYGERIVAADPPAGFLRPEDFPTLDRFTVQFEEANYVHVDEIGVELFDADGNRQEATGDSGPPTVVATRRLDNGPPDVVEIVLDKPIPLDARTVFTFDDGTIRQNVAYTYIQGDANADGRFDLHDAAELQNCFLDESVTGHCWAFDFDGNEHISAEDFATFSAMLAGPE